MHGPCCAHPDVETNIHGYQTRAEHRRRRRSVGRGSSQFESGRRESVRDVCRVRRPGQLMVIGERERERGTVYGRPFARSWTQRKENEKRLLGSTFNCSSD